jgi:hypothetical protein
MVSWYVPDVERRGGVSTRNSRNQKSVDVRIVTLLILPSWQPFRFEVWTELVTVATAEVPQW